MKRKTGNEKPAMEFVDYEVIIDRDNLPDKVTIEEKI